ncbi:MAG: aminomethyl-transferring glycine dehydrogenase subunit GcvPA [Alphaproteobacteria bacterium]|nr:aminomethyl-transferring glycine dehydrogenase subunit GcvPA [Alphaproteobacteria bacterium]MCB9927833.1 aminomethyl-transferring glycine dehydrogenase subunit GcvPA [Alphaproteobacteria bacterium]
MRYLPLTQQDREAMLATVGAASIDDLFCDVPAEARLDGLLDLPRHAGEMAVERHLSRLAMQNHAAGEGPCFLGAGAYRHHVPASVDYLIQRGEFLTAYTPYQPEIAQGTLQVLFEFQTQVALLTGMEVANASMYDGATSCAEAVMMAARVTRRHKALLSGNLHPHYRDVTETLCRMTDFPIAETAPTVAGADVDALAAAVDDTVGCVVVQYPDAFGHIADLTPLAEACHAAGALMVVVCTEVVALGALTPPGAMGADIVVGEGQGIGNALNFGGPYLGLFATRSKLVRQMPGRVCGETVDADGQRGYVLTLSTREQHIRREKATSNICTNSGLCALAFSIHLSLLGEAGLHRLAAWNHATAVQTAERLARVPGVEVLNPAFFNEFAVRLPQPAAPVVDALAEQGLLAGVPASRLYPDRPELADVLLVAATETVEPEDIEALALALTKELAA